MWKLGMYVKRFAKHPMRYICHPVRTIQIYKDLNSHRDTVGKLQLLFPEDREGGWTVKHGPFEGLRYPSHELTTGACLWNVLLGSFEMCLHPIIEEALKEHYDFCINVGCAEGYYAIGFALKGNVDNVIGFDIDETSRKYCEIMAKYNGVEVEVRDWCTEEVLRDFDFKKKSIIISDCEGYERKMFSPENVSNLKNVDILVEVHDFCQYETKTLEYLIDLFKDTHDYTIIHDVDDYEKAYDYKFDELKDFKILERKYVLMEGRYRIGEWLWLKAQN